MMVEEDCRRLARGRRCDRGLRRRRGPAPGLARWRPALVRPAQRGARLLGRIGDAEARPAAAAAAAEGRSAGGAGGRLGARRHPRSGGGPRHPHGAARRHRRAAARGHRGAGGRARSARRPDAGPHHRGERAARQGSRGRARDASTALGLVPSDAGGPGAGHVSSHGAAFFGAQEAAGAQGAGRRRAGARSARAAAQTALDECGEDRATGCSGKLRRTGRQSR